MGRLVLEEDVLVVGTEAGGKGRQGLDVFPGEVGGEGQTLASALARELRSIFDSEIFLLIRSGHVMEQGRNLTLSQRASAHWARGT